MKSSQVIGESMRLNFLVKLSDTDLAPVERIRWAEAISKYRRPDGGASPDHDGYGIKERDYTLL